MWKLNILIVIFLASRTVDANELCCNHNDTSFLDVAIQMLEKAKENYPKCQKEEDCSFKPKDCADWLVRGYNVSQVYTIWLQNRITGNKKLEVYCDMKTDGGGWTVIQRRGNFSRPKDYFYQDWKSYKLGFGNIEEDFWLGNDNIFAFTNQELYSVRFDLKDVSGEERYALYDHFWIYDENMSYTLHIDDYRGNAGDSMIESHNGKKFSTKDRDNDDYLEGNCANIYKGGWWYSKCHSANLNGLYLRGRHDSYADGVNWYTFRGHKESLDTTEIKLRPKNFRKNLQKI